MCKSHMNSLEQRERGGKATTISVLAATPHKISGKWICRGALNNSAGRANRLVRARDYMINCKNARDAKTEAKRKR